MKFEVTMACSKGHRLTVDEDEVRSLNATACTVCRRPLMAVQVKPVAERRERKTAPRRCTVHINGDICCRRQGRAAS